MGEGPSTRASLLVRLRDHRDADAWRQFVGLYGPMVFRFARKRGLQEAEAADYTQTVFQALAGAIPEFDYDPRQGRFRGWLFGVVRRQLQKFLEKQARAPQGSGDTGAHARLAEQPGPDDQGDEALWEQEYQRQLFARAADVVRGEFAETSWQAFWQTAVEGKAAAEAAAALGISVGAVYTAKSRVLDRIRQAVERLQHEE